MVSEWRAYVSLFLLIIIIIITPPVGSGGVIRLSRAYRSIDERIHLLRLSAAGWMDGWMDDSFVKCCSHQSVASQSELHQSKLNWEESPDCVTSGGTTTSLSPEDENILPVPEVEVFWLLPDCCLQQLLSNTLGQQLSIDYFYSLDCLKFVTVAITTFVSSFFSLLPELPGQMQRTVGVAHCGFVASSVR